MHAATQNTPSRQTLIRALIIGALSTGLVACGGGGPGGADLVAGGSSGGGGGGGTTPTPVPIAPAAKLTVTPAQATLALGDSVQVTTLVVDANNKPVSGAVVSLTTDNTIGLLSPTAGLTNSAGQFISTLSVASINSSGKVGEIAASAKFKNTTGTDQTLSNSMVYQVNSVALKIESMQAGLSSISANANTSIEVTVSANGKAISGQTVNFASQCSQSGKAAIDATAVTNASGKAIASFTDKGCSTNDIVTATLSNGQSKNINLNIAPPTASSLQFTSISPADGVITLKGYGTAARPETAQVKFKVVDASGAPIAGQPVVFSLDTTTGGVALENASAGKVTSVTDSTGIATATILSGIQPTPIRVTATSGALVSTSGKLAISSGFPDQDSLSFSAEKYNINGWNYDGETTKITMRFADHFNNPVPDGTTINFITDGGRIGTGTQGSCQTADSSCQITLTSQNPRPSNGRVHVLAYAIGEESFVDRNNNIVADADNELIDDNNSSTDIGEAFLDKNENKVFDLGNDQLVDFNGNNTYDGPDGKLNATLCSSNYAKCSTQKTLHIFQQATFIFSSDDPSSPVLSSALAGTCGSTQAFTAYIPDSKGNILPAGTTISIANTSGAGSVVSGGSHTIGSGVTTQNSQVLGKTSFSFLYKFGSTCPVVAPNDKGLMTITVTTPAGGGQAAKTTSFPFSYSIN